MDVPRVRRDHDSDRLAHHVTSSHTMFGRLVGNAVALPMIDEAAGREFLNKGGVGSLRGVWMHDPQPQTPLRVSKRLLYVARWRLPVRSRYKGQTIAASVQTHAYLRHEFSPQRHVNMCIVCLEPGGYRFKLSHCIFFAEDRMGTDGRRAGINVFGLSLRAGTSDTLSQFNK